MSSENPNVPINIISVEKESFIPIHTRKLVYLSKDLFDPTNIDDISFISNILKEHGMKLKEIHYKPNHLSIHYVMESGSEEDIHDASDEIYTQFFSQLDYMDISFISIQSP